LPLRNQPRQAAETVARQLRFAAIGIEQPHGRATLAQTVKDDAVGACSGVTCAEATNGVR